MNTTEAIAAIGNMNSTEIKSVFDAANARSKQLRAQRAAENSATMTPGTRVVTANLRPKYLSGLHATVIAGETRRRGDILINIDESDRYFANSARYNLSRLAVPASSLIAETNTEASNAA
jgi:hypothetical protein